MVDLYLVPSQRVEQQDLHAQHRIRGRRFTARPALVPAMRGLLHEDGMALAQSLARCRALLVDQLREEQATRTTLSPEVCCHRSDEVLAVGNRLTYGDEELAAVGRAHPACQRLQTIPGIGPLRAPALITARGDVTPVTDGRPRAARHGASGAAHAGGALGVNSSCTAREPRAAESARRVMTGVHGGEPSSPAAASPARPSRRPITMPEWAGRSWRTPKRSASEPSEETC